MDPQNAAGKGDQGHLEEYTTTTQVIADIHIPPKNKDVSFEQSDDAKIDAEISGFTEVAKKQGSEDMDVTIEPSKNKSGAEIVILIDGSPSHSKSKISIAKYQLRSCLPRKSKTRAYEKLRSVSKSSYSVSIVRGRKHRNVKRLKKKPAPRRYEYVKAPKRKIPPPKVYRGGSGTSFSSSYGTGSNTSGSY